LGWLAGPGKIGTHRESAARSQPAHPFGPPFFGASDEGWLEIVGRLPEKQSQGFIADDSSMVKSQLVV
jgi:hypothetical protein